MILKNYRGSVSFIAVLLFVSAVVCFAQQRKYRVMTYNVENLFDTCHDAGFDDYEFLPSSDRGWNSRRYWTKQGWISRTIVAACGVSPIDLIALCEVENDSVVKDLVMRTKLYRLGYEYLVTNSRDRRGIDVALLYQPERFLLLSDSALVVPVRKDYGRPTRDILYVSGRTPDKDTIDVFVNHWPSRRGGSNTAEEYRIFTAQVLRHFADSLLAVRRNPNLIFLGDFNDEYHNKSISRGLGAVVFPHKSEGDYVVLSADLKARDGIRGTYKYRGFWNQLDQIIVSRSMLERKKGLRISSQSCRILSYPFLTEPDESRGGVKPFRTFLGPVYKGGISDHLPLLLEMEW